MAGPGVGDRAPEFELPGSGDRTYSLADYRGKGLILFVDGQEIARGETLAPLTAKLPAPPLPSSP